MHAEAMEFLGRARQKIASIDGCKIIELGSHDVNGSARSVFTGCAEYIGVDTWPGNGVDIVADARDYDGKEAFDIAISTEALEHDPEPWVLLQSAYRALKPSGLFIVTAAAPPRKPHTCAGIESDDANGESYQNIDPGWLRKWLTQHGWSVIHLEWNGLHGDVYAMAVKL